MRPEPAMAWRDPEAWPALERLDYAPLAGRWAVIRMVANLGVDVDLPAGARLIVNRGGATSSHGPFVSASDRRAGSSASELLWVASFAIPLEVVECPDARFQLTANGHAALALPRPGSLIVPPAYVIEPAVHRWFPGHLRYRLTALATAMAVAASSSSVTGLALAAESPTPSARTVSGAGAPAPGTGSVSTKRHKHRWKVTAHPAGLPASATTKPKPATAHTAKPKPATAHTTKPKPATTHTTKPKPATAHTAKPKPATAHTAKPKPATTNSTKPASKRAVPALRAWNKPSGPTDTRVPAAPAKPHAHHHAGPQSPASAHHPSGGAPMAAPVVSPPAPKADDGPQLASGSVPSPSPALANVPGVIPAAGIPLSRLSTLFAVVPGPPPFLIPTYKQAGRRYHVPWQVLAAINSIETDYGRDLSVSSAGAIGWMQFMPATWQQYGVAADGHSQPNPFNPRDAIFSAARYLQANGAPHNLVGAIFAYNHANWYVDEVLWRAQLIRDRAGLRIPGEAGKKVAAMTAMAKLLIGKPYIWGGGHADWQIVPGYDCSGFVSAVLHAAGYLSAPQTTETLPYQPAIKAGPGQYVTIFDRAGAGMNSHAIIDLNGTFYESGGSGVGAGVKKLQPSPDYLASFNTLLHPAGL